MEVTFSVTYHEHVKNLDLPKIDSSMKHRIKSAIENKLMVNPLHFGIQLRRSLKGYCKLRVGNYRIVFKLLNDKKEVRILGIMHRSVVYNSIEKRV